MLMRAEECAAVCRDRCQQQMHSQPSLWCLASKGRDHKVQDAAATIDMGTKCCFCEFQVSLLPPRYSQALEKVTEDEKIKSELRWETSGKGKRKERGGGGIPINCFLIQMHCHLHGIRCCCEEPSYLYREGSHERGLDEDRQPSSFAVVLED